MRLDNRKTKIVRVILMIWFALFTFCISIGDESAFFLINYGLSYPLIDFVVLNVLVPLFSLVFVVPILMLFSKKYRSTGLFSLLSGVIAYLVGDYLKEWFRRPRPYIVLPARIVGSFYTSSYSFPSTTTALVFGISLFILFEYPRSWISHLLILLSSLVSFSVIYTGFHYPLDVLFGFLLALAVSIIIGSIKEKRLS